MKDDELNLYFMNDVQDRYLCLTADTWLQGIP